MAIQHRRGIYSRFDPTRLVAGEWAVVLSGDPLADDGMAAYVCFAAGTVKRVATYEDMADYLENVRQESVDWIVNTANAGFKEEYTKIRDDAVAAENERIANELARIANEDQRIINEDKRILSETARDSAEVIRQNNMDAWMEGVQKGDFDGATFTPSVSEEGLLSWTNNKGLSNPITISVRGEKGDNGVVSTLGAGLYLFEIQGDFLTVVYEEGTETPDLEIEDGCLWLNLEE